MPTQADHSGHSGHGWLNVCTLAPLKVCALALVLGAGAVAMQLVVGLACEVPPPPLLSGIDPAACPAGYFGSSHERKGPAQVSQVGRKFANPTL